MEAMSHNIGALYFYMYFNIILSYAVIFILQYISVLFYIFHMSILYPIISAVVFIFIF